MAKKAIFLDRDGTIIVDRIHLNDPEGIEYLPGTFEGLRLFRDMGFLLIVATNQSGVARGIVSIENLYRIHSRIRSDLSREGIDIAAFYYSPYGPDSGHVSRKPGPGMLLTAARDFGLDLSQCWMIGDKMLDVEAGHNAGARSVLLGEPPFEHKRKLPDLISGNLFEAAETVLRILS